MVSNAGRQLTECTSQLMKPTLPNTKIGSMGRPLPGCPVTRLSPAGEEADEGEICVALSGKPLGVTSGYAGDELLTAERMKDGYYRTGDIATRDSEGYLTYVGRADDVFKSSDYRISPFELESVIIEHEAVVEAAVVPSLDPIRLAVPKAFIVLVEGYVPCAEIASSILAHIRQRVSPFKRVRRLEFGVLPKTVSGKIRRVDLKKLEEARDDTKERRPNEFWEEDFS
jgi:acetyl-CoA synthetase